MRVSPITIGKLAARSGTNSPTIRYYEDIGLLRRPDRSDSGRRVYDEGDVRRLSFIRSCRDLGLSIDECRALLEIIEREDRSCLEAKALVQARLADVQSRITQLLELQERLSAFVAECEDTCQQAPTTECTVMRSARRAVRA